MEHVHSLDEVLFPGGVKAFVLVLICTGVLTGGVSELDSESDSEESGSEESDSGESDSEWLESRSFWSVLGLSMLLGFCFCLDDSGSVDLDLSSKINQGEGLSNVLS